jgi:hypothetical protein
LANSPPIPPVVLSLNVMKGVWKWARKSDPPRGNLGA